MASLLRLWKVRGPQFRFTLGFNHVSSESLLEKTPSEGATAVPDRTAQGRLENRGSAKVLQGTLPMPREAQNNSSYHSERTLLFEQQEAISSQQHLF
jgi:hypothetical protein